VKIINLWRFFILKLVSRKQAATEAFSLALFVEAFKSHCVLDLIGSKLITEFLQMAVFFIGLAVDFVHEKWIHQNFVVCLRKDGVDRYVFHAFLFDIRKAFSFVLSNDGLFKLSNPFLIVA
jgi:hypothetical protein